MKNAKFRPGSLLCGCAVVAAVVIPACDSTFVGGAADGLGLRIENDTPSSAKITFELLDALGNPIDETALAAPVQIPVIDISPGNIQVSTLQPVGATAELSTGGGVLAASSTVQVPGLQVSEGGVFCAPVVKVTAAVGEEDAPVRLTGDGTGTPGFDSGSVGEAGERFLVEGDDYFCGQAVVMSIDDDGTSVGGSESGSASGRIAVIEAGSGSPFDNPFDAGADSGEGDSSGGADASTNSVGDQDVAADTIRVRIDNQASRIATVDLLVGTTSGDQTFNASVPADEITEGDFTCGTQLTITAGFPDPDSQEVDPDGPEALVILTGDGTGSPGFDGSSVSLDGQRVLVVGTHVECGDTVLVTLQGDAGGGSAPIGFEGLIVLGGSVEVLKPGESVDDVSTGDTADMVVNVVNQTNAFVSVSVFGAVGALVGTQDIFVPAGSQSSGTVACAEGYLVSAKSLTAAALQGLVDEVLVVLEGEGTGSANFDEGSVGQDGSRLLQINDHYQCGDTITVTVTDPGMPGFTEPTLVDTNGIAIGFDDVNGNNIQDEVADRLGAGTVAVD